MKWFKHIILLGFIIFINVRFIQYLAKQEHLRRIQNSEYGFDGGTGWFIILGITISISIISYLSIIYFLHKRKLKNYQKK